MVALGVESLAPKRNEVACEIHIIIVISVFLNNMVGTRSAKSGEKASG